MKTRLLTLACASLCLVAPNAVHAQGGSLRPPPGAPAPTMRSLQEIWDKLEQMDATHQTLQSKLDAQSGQIHGLVQVNAVLLESLGVQIPWEISII